MATSIYVGNLSYNTNGDDLQQIFSAYGTVESAKVMSDKFTGRSRGFGFVEMPSAEEAQAAIEALHETEIDGRRVSVNEARPRTESNDRGSYGGGGGSRGGYNGGNGGGRNRY